VADMNDLCDTCMTKAGREGGAAQSTPFATASIVELVNGHLDAAVASKIMSYWPVNEHRTRNENALGMETTISSPFSRFHSKAIR
jgi:hypothetical protein